MFLGIFYSQQKQNEAGKCRRVLCQLYVSQFFFLEKNLKGFQKWSQFCEKWVEDRIYPLTFSFYNWSWLRVMELYSVWHVMICSGAWGRCRCPSQCRTYIFELYAELQLWYMCGSRYMIWSYFWQCLGILMTWQCLRIEKTTEIPRSCLLVICSSH